MNTALTSLHHVTATVADAQSDLDFYTRFLGLRLVKKTVNFDNTGVYHFYYGNAHGVPGTIMTTFPYAYMGVRTGTKGSGQIITTAFSVPTGSLGYWRSRLEEQGIRVHDREPRFGASVIACSDPSGLDIELIESGNDHRAPWTGSDVVEKVAIRGIHSLTMSIESPDATVRVLLDLLGFADAGTDGNRMRFGLGDGAPGKVVDLLHEPDAPRGLNGMGTVHHVAFSIPTGEGQLELREKVLRHGLNVTDVRDRKYFTSIYFREPGGVLFEVATAGPGFVVDEDEASLGQSLKLPDWNEADRREIESLLPEVKH